MFGFIVFFFRRKFTNKINSHSVLVIVSDLKYCRLCELKTDGEYKNKTTNKRIERVYQSYEIAIHEMGAVVLILFSAENSHLCNDD